MEVLVCFNGVYYIAKKQFIRIAPDSDPMYLEECDCPCGPWTACEIRVSDSEAFNKIVFDDIVKAGMR